MAGHIEQRPIFGCLTYKTSVNLGDEVQSIAAIENIKKVDGIISYYIDRDTRELTPINKSIYVGDEKIICIYNGWFDKNYCHWPPSANIVPLFVSFHINEVDKGDSYRILDKYLISRPPSLADSKFIDYYSKFSPIYTRDIHTQNKLPGSKFLGCLTMTLENDKRDELREGAFMVDVDPLSYHDIPEDIRTSSMNMTHISFTKDPTLRLAEAQKLLDTYKRAKLVITSRLHCALPCLAYDTPVVLLLSTWETDPRFTGLDHLFTIHGRDKIDWYNHQNKDPIEFRNMASKLSETVADIIKSKHN